VGVAAEAGEKKKKRWHCTTARLLERGKKTKAREEGRGKRVKHP